MLGCDAPSSREPRPVNEETVNHLSHATLPIHRYTLFDTSAATAGGVYYNSARPITDYCSLSLSVVLMLYSLRSVKPKRILYCIADGIVIRVLWLTNRKSLTVASVASSLHNNFASASKATALWRYTNP